MISPDIALRIRQVLTHQPFLCSSVFLFELRDGQPHPYDDESKECLLKYPQHTARAATISPTCWDGNAVGSTGGKLLGGKCYASCIIRDLVLIASKALEPPNSSRGPSPLDSYFLDTLSNRVAQIVGAGEVLGADFQLGKVTHEGGQVLSELRALRDCESLWRLTYGVDEWLAVKDGQVVAHNRERSVLEKLVKTNNIQPPVLYVPPKGKDEIAEIDFLRITSNTKL